MDWNDLRHFLTLARLGSVRAAGKALGVSHSTVARRVEALEAQLDTRLFDRSPDGWALTAAGREMRPRAEGVERELADLERALVGQDERLAGTVAVTCGDPFVSALLLDAFGRFCAAHPEIELVFTTDARPFDLAKREADVAVRVLGIGVDPPPSLLGTRLAPVILDGYVAVAHADRLDPEGGAARWLAFDDARVVASLIADSSYPALPPWGSFNALDAMVHAARAGLGLALLPVYVGDRDPMLTRLPRRGPRHVADLWLLSHPDLRHTARVRATRSVVAACFEAHAGWFRGDAWSDLAPGRPDSAPRTGLEPAIPESPPRGDR